MSQLAEIPVTISLYHMVWIIKRMPNTCGSLFMLNEYLKSPSPAEEAYILSILNTSSNECRADTRFSYNPSNNKWEWF